MKKLFFKIVSYAFYYLGDFISKFPEFLAWCWYPVYNWAMFVSVDIQEKYLKDDGPWELVKYPSDKKKIEVYESLLKDIARNVDFYNDKNVSHLLRNISRWSYAHRCGNGELTEEEQYDTVVKEFHRLRELGRYDPVESNTSDQTNLK